MISRLTLSAVIFAIIGTASLALAASAHQAAVASQVAAKQVRVVQLERVVIVGKRLAPATGVAQTDAADTSAPRVQ